MDFNYQCFQAAFYRLAFPFFVKNYCRTNLFFVLEGFSFQE